MINEFYNLNTGCGIEYHKFTVKCYAADIGSLAPSLAGVRKLVEDTCGKLSNLCPKVIVLECCHKVSRKPVRIEIPFNTISWTVVGVWVFLFLKISEDLTCDLDINGVTKLFTKKVIGL